MTGLFSYYYSGFVLPLSRVAFFLLNGTITMAFHFSMSIHKAGFPPTLETGLPFYGYWPFSDWPSWKELYKRRARRTSGSGNYFTVPGGCWGII